MRMQFGTILKNLPAFQVPSGNQLRFNRFTNKGGQIELKVEGSVVIIYWLLISKIIGFLRSR